MFVGNLLIAQHIGSSLFAFSSSKYNLIIVSGVRGHSWVPWGLFIGKMEGKRLQVSEMDLFIYCDSIQEVLECS